MFQNHSRTIVSSCQRKNKLNLISLSPMHLFPAVLTSFIVSDSVFPCNPKVSVSALQVFPHAHSAILRRRRTACRPDNRTPVPASSTHRYVLLRMRTVFPHSLHITVYAPRRTAPNTVSRSGVLQSDGSDTVFFNIPFPSGNAITSEVKVELYKQIKETLESWGALIYPPVIR